MSGDKTDELRYDEGPFEFEDENSAMLECDENWHQQSPSSSGHFEYGVTPPRDIRQTRRNKVREKKNRNDQRAGSVEQETKNGCTKVGSRDNSEDRLRAEARPQMRKKIPSRNRQYERDYKRASNADIHVLSSSPNSGTQTIKMEIKNKYRCLPAEPIAFSSFGDNAKRHSITEPDCPSDRFEFHRVFSMLIQMGTAARRERENQTTPFLRQLSSEQEFWVTKYKDLLWLDLRAWHSGKNMQEVDGELVRMRKEAITVLQDVMTFNVTFSSDVPADDSLGSVVERQKVALKQVDMLLDKLERVEHLFPTLKALSQHHELYRQESFQSRVNTLCLWLNITRDMAQKLCMMARMLQLDAIPGLEWPWFDYENPTCQTMSADILTPQIIVSHEDDDEYEDDEDYEDDNPEEGKPDKGKRVLFNASDPSSPEVEMPKPTFEGQNFSTLSSHSSFASVSSVMSPVSSEGSTLHITRTAIYRQFVDKTLKRTGLRKVLLRLHRLLNRTLKRAEKALEFPEPVPTYADIVGTSKRLSELLSSSPATERAMFPDFTDSLPLRETTQTCSQFVDMNLPSFKSVYLFLVRIPLDVIHECLRLRLEQRPDRDPSMLSVRQLIRECKEVLIAAVDVKQYYLSLVRPVTGGKLFDGEERIELDLEEFELDMKKMMEVYFHYLQTWMRGLQNMEEMSKGLKNVLEEEWNFTKKVCMHIRGGEADASNKFCNMASFLLESIGDFLGIRMDECLNQLYDSTLSDSKQCFRSIEKRSALTQLCRLFKNHFREARERASKALGFAKILRKDIEIAAEFRITFTSLELMDKLKETDHLRVMAPHSTDYLMFVPGCLGNETDQVLQLINVTCGRDDDDRVSDKSDSHAGYLLLVKCQSCSDHPDMCPLWTGKVLMVEPTADATIALSHVEVKSLLLVVINSSLLSSRRREFERQMDSGVELVNEQTSCHQFIADALAELKNAALNLRNVIADTIQQVEERLTLDDILYLDDAERQSVHKLYRETLLQCYNFGFEYHKELGRLISGELRIQLGQLSIQFAQQWMKFVAEKCERGRGSRPRWASHGLDFLIVATEPRILGSLTDEQFKKLQDSLNKCISHVIGDRSTPGSPVIGYRVGSPDFTSHRNFSRNVSVPLESRSCNSAMRSNTSEPATPMVRELGARKSSLFDMRPDEGHDGISPPPINSKVTRRYGEDPMPRIASQIRVFEQKRTDKLYQQRVIGRVLDKVSAQIHFHSRRVPFRWQRGNKIGEGQFGKVYNAVNVDTGEMMAMKEISLIRPNDMQTVKEVVDEIKIFEGLSHPNLIKYYGVEVHREEMIIFMEHCNEGTVADVARTGLTEVIVRKYTWEILTAVNYLHDHDIVHRDIKGANIFLQSHGPLKLGDFGCAVKLKNTSTMFGEVKKVAGTTAFMAPEVFTRGDASRHGKPTDIWSLGCVVIEMVTGKSPWKDIERMAIMFRVGLGQSPPVPESLSEEGQDFVSKCLVHDPQQRATAIQLLGHPFPLVDVDDEPS